MDCLAYQHSYAAHKKLAERKIARMTSESGLLNGRALGELYAYSNDVAIALLKSPEAPDGIDAVLVRLDGVQHKASSWGPLMLRRAERLGYSIDELMAWWSEDHVINGVLGAGTVGDKECLTFPRLEIDASQLTAARYQVLKSGAKPDCLVVYVDVADIETMQRITQLSARTLALCGELDQEACGHLITSLHATPSTETLVIRDAEISNENAQRLQAIESLKHLAIPGANISEQEVRAWKDDRYFPLESLVLPEALAATKDELLDKRIALQIEFSPPGKPTVPRGSP